MTESELFQALNSNEHDYDMRNKIKGGFTLFQYYVEENEWGVVYLNYPNSDTSYLQELGYNTQNYTTNSQELKWNSPNKMENYLFTSDSLITGHDSNNPNKVVLDVEFEETEKGRMVKSARVHVEGSNIDSE